MTTPDVARTALLCIALPMMSWTVLARIRFGHRWTTSVLLRRLFKRDPILGQALHGIALLLFVPIVPEFGYGDLALVWVVFVGLGHITW